MNQISPVSELLTVSEASAILRLKPSTIRSWLLKKKVTSVKLGGRVFIRNRDCLALIEAGVVPAKPSVRVGAEQVRY